MIPYLLKMGLRIENLGTLVVIINNVVYYIYMIKLKLYEVVESYPQLEELVSIDMPIEIGYKLLKIKEKVLSETKLYEIKRLELIKRLGKQTDKKKDIWNVKEENSEEFFKELNKLRDIPVSLEFEKIKLSELGDIVVKPKFLVSWLFE